MYRFPDLPIPIGVISVYQRSGFCLSDSGDVAQSRRFRRSPCISGQVFAFPISAISRDHGDVGDLS
jgi:hypothetical protein